ncbi:Kef-type K+ transport system membrane component KefB [Dyadobacter sp. BE34]|uniref:Kef-type K+ transport system membrane component KefB n=1 Tax=Dyadobacter fermentans TaxID=94254 RepID=A0ABU1QV37_9BACT|nr:MULTISPECIES: cation:proton antiporter [Dyadobacter]MDR6805011.1 Kef-type K+ transport system membrane component KefB [Dyadobacter fermentans]MDR7043230.1 Kef-type K+ transport system membrane component KefB [Dyadobacter sp. BE242]MDR7197542.1 Kef-type K+ transport system membrane component KefB [Dyadobacter sp. BE34]MDR7215025.1 Kef-type K+ transport system membrane component KefB [Dyadobacter sp. BE31]MDR7262560.1 Kef-type K+ transport system membrane component KefB [Dyadobacter sp. BE32]
MMTLLNLHIGSLPIEDPVLKFLLELIIILSAPLLLNKIKVPHLLGLLIAGAVVGPNGLNLLSRDSSVVVTGTTGLLYIMFLAGLEIDMGDFKKNMGKSITFTVFTFAVPFILGLIGGYYVLHFSMLTSVLFASLFSSHTLIAYPIVSKMGVAKNLSVNITVGGTMLTDVLSLLVLAVVVGMTQGEVNSAFWLRLGLSVAAFSLTVLFVFPIIGRWFFKKVDDKISQYIFVLVMIYLAAVLAELAGIEAIIGAFFAGLALNRLIPHTSALMNRVEFVGNAIFIPFFLISVGMLIDFTVFFKSLETLVVAAVMLVASIGGKYLAAVFTQKTFRLTKDEGMIIFGLSSASAAATLAAVMVGYNIILSETESGEPVRLLSEHVLNGSILLILISCTISSFVSMSSAAKIAEADNEATASGANPETENILIAVNYEDAVEKSVNLGLLIKAGHNKDRLFALNVINDEKNESSVRNAEKTLHTAVTLAAAADVQIRPLTRYDSDVATGISNVIKEQKITDLIVALQPGKGLTPSFVYNLTNGYLQNENVNTLIYHAAQPISTIKKYIVLIPPKADKEPGFFHALLRVWNIGKSSGSEMAFYASAPIIGIIERVAGKSAIELSLHTIDYWGEAEQAAASLEADEGLILFMAKRGMASFFPRMGQMPDFLNQHALENNFLLIYPFSQQNADETEKRSVSNHDDFVQIGRMIGKIFPG